MPTPTLCRASADDLARMLDFAAAEGWNPGLGDVAPFLAADPQGFLVAMAGASPVGCISVVRYGPDFGFLGFYIVLPGWRGQGIGLSLWQAGLAHLGTRRVGLDGVVAQQENYRRSGFEFCHRTLRFEGVPRCGGAAFEAVRPVDVVPFAALVAYDAAHFGVPRPEFLKVWCDGAGGRVARVVLRDGAMTGFGVIRPARNGFKIGPLFAETVADAETLLAALADAAQGAPVALDVPEPNGMGVALAARLGLEAQFECARMMRGGPLALPLDRIFGNTSFELG